MNELTQTQRELDARAVEQALTEIMPFLRQASANKWQEANREGYAYMRGLFNEFEIDLPERDKATSAIIGGSALALIKLRYGPNEMQPRLYSGSYESNVIATYHHADHSRQVARDMFRYAAACNAQRPESFTPQDYAYFPILAGLHDPIIGNGRGNDERQSGLLASECMIRMGLRQKPDEATQVPIEATIWDEVRKMQSMRPARGYAHLQRALTAADLLPLFDERGPYRTSCLAPEDFSKKIFGQVFQHEAMAGRFPLQRASIIDCMQLIDQRPRLNEMYGAFLKDQVSFLAQFTPTDPNLDHVSRQAGKRAV